MGSPRSRGRQSQSNSAPPLHDCLEMILKYFLSLVLSLVSASLSAAETLCGPQEEVFFSCKLPQKTMSICASKDLTATTGWLQYRYGESKSNVELIYPNEWTHPKDKFVHRTEAGAKEYLGILGFAKGPYRYSVFVTRSGTGFNGAGVIVAQNGSRISFHECQKHTLIDIGLVERASDLKIPDGEVDYPPGE